MPRGITFSYEDKKRLVWLVEHEIQEHREGRVNRLITSQELGLGFGVSRSLIRRYLSCLGDKNRRYRDGILRSQNGKRVAELGLGLYGLTYEEKIEVWRKVKRLGVGIYAPGVRSGGGKKSAELGVGIHALTHEERSRNTRKLAELGLGLYGLTHKQRVENGKKAAELGIGMHTPDMRSKAGKMGGKKITELRLGIHGFTHKQRVENGKKVAEIVRKSSYYVGGRFHIHSQQEGAVALLLEKYLPGFEILDGENFQVRDRGMENGGIDFLIDGKFLEWHPTLLYSGGRGDIPSGEEAKSYRKVLESLPENEREGFIQNYTRVLAVNYRNSRQEAVDNSEYSGMNVALATNPRQVYDFLVRYGASLPDFSEFNKEFKDKVKYVKGFKVKRKQETEVA